MSWSVIWSPGLARTLWRAATLARAPCPHALPRIAETRKALGAVLLRRALGGREVHERRPEASAGVTLQGPLQQRCECQEADLVDLMTLCWGWVCLAEIFWRQSSKLDHCRPDAKHVFFEHGDMYKGCLTCAYHVR